MGFGAIKWKQSWKTRSTQKSLALGRSLRSTQARLEFFSKFESVKERKCSGQREAFTDAWTRWKSRLSGGVFFIFKKGESWLWEMIYEAGIKSMAENHINILQTFKCSGTWAKSNSWVSSLSKLLRLKVSGARLMTPGIRLILKILA